MAEEGAPLVAGNSELLNGPLGNCLIGFNGYMLGKTTEDTQLAPDEDVKEILYSQEGTKAADLVTTGAVMMLTATFAEIKTSLLSLLKSGFSSLATPGSGDDSGTFGRFLYSSHRDNRAGVLRLYATDSNGFALLDDEDVTNFYEVVPIVNDNLINWGADTQRNLPVQFWIFFKKFDTPIALGPLGAFGYFGDPAQEKVPAAAWPDIAAPVLVSATATTATNIDLVFDENIATQGGALPAMIVAKVNGSYISPSSIGAPSGVGVALTFPAASFANGDTIELSISALVFEDTETVPNAYLGVDGATVINTVP